MATIALVDASPATAALMEAAATGCTIVRCAGCDVPGDAGVVIADSAATTATLDAIAATAVPALLLIDRGARNAAARKRSDRFTILENPCDLLLLRRELRALLEQGSVPVPELAGSETGAEPGSKSVPVPDFLKLVPVPDFFAGLAGLRGAVWILGEAGTGTEHLAGALAGKWDAGRGPVVWDEDDRLSDAAAALDDVGRVLWVPGLDSRSMRDQRALERFLATEPGRRVVVTGGDRPEDAVADGRLLPMLFTLLSGAAVRVAPLRERTDDIPRLVAFFAARATGGQDRRFSAEAVRLLQTYPWPGNLAELDAVVTRTVLAHSGAEIDARDILFAPSLTGAPAERSDTPRDVPASTARRAVVVPLTSAPPRAPETSDKTFDDERQAGAGASQSTATSSGVESVLAAFAHDLRNPMATIKTFAGLQTDGGELAQLAADACERVDEHLRLLQRYTEVVSDARDRSADSTVDLVEILADAIETVGADDALQIEARGAAEVRCDEAVARFVADAIVAECVGRADRDATGGPATADVPKDRPAIAIRIPAGTAAIERLGKWLAASELPWRLAIARDAARRFGGELSIDATDGDTVLEWSMSRGAEVARSAPVRTAASQPRAAQSRPKATSR